MDNKPDAVIIHVDTNPELRKSRRYSRNIIKIGLHCKSFGVNDIVISGRKSSNIPLKFLKKKIF